AGPPTLARSAVRRLPPAGSAEPSYGPGVVLVDAVRHRAAVRASIQMMNRPTPIRDERPSGVGPRTLKTEPSRKIAAATRPATPSQRPTRPVRRIASHRAGTMAGIAQDIGGRPCSP